MLNRLNTLLLSFTLSLCAPLHAYAKDIPIDQKSREFTPDTVTLQKGDVLVFTNHDTVNHNIEVVNAEGDAEDKGLQRPGEIVRHTFSEPGQFNVRCQIHPDMLLTITVK